MSTASNTPSPTPTFGPKIEVRRNIALQRLPDWEVRFTEFMADCLRESIVLDWVHYNCASYASDAVEAITGVDIYEEFRGLSKSPASACAMIRRAGYTSLSDIVADKLPEKALPFVKRGDLVLMPIEATESSFLLDEETCALLGSGPDQVSAPQVYTSLGMPHAVCVAAPPVAWCITEGGLVAVDVMQAVKAFAVGEI